MKELLWKYGVCLLWKWKLALLNIARKTADVLENIAERKKSKGDL